MDDIANDFLAPIGKTSREPLRIRKRRDTRERIATAAFSFFVEIGFDNTSIDMIAERAGIARRTFFYYFPSKEDIIYSDKGELEEMIVAAGELSADIVPLDAVEEILIRTIRCYDRPDSLSIDRVMRSTPLLMERRHFHYERRERNMFLALQQIWPDSRHLEILRCAAMSGVGVLRIAADLWSQERGQKPLKALIQMSFRSLREALGA